MMILKFYRRNNNSIGLQNIYSIVMPLSNAVVCAYIQMHKLMRFVHYTISIEIVISH